MEALNKHGLQNHPTPDREKAATEFFADVPTNATKEKLKADEDTKNSKHKPRKERRWSSENTGTKQNKDENNKENRRPNNNNSDNNRQNHKFQRNNTTNKTQHQTKNDSQSFLTT